MKMWNASRTRRKKVLDEGPVSPGAEEGYRRGRTGYLQLVVYYNTLAISVRDNHSNLAAVLFVIRTTCIHGFPVISSEAHSCN